MSHSSSATTICNMALAFIGAKRIADFNETTTLAQKCRDVYDEMLDDLLRAHQWNFATRRVQLAQLTTTPEFEFDNEYALPTDWLRTVTVHDNSSGSGAVRYKIESRVSDGVMVLRSDAGNIYLRYIARITEANRMAADFRMALAYYIASALAISVADSNTLEARMFQNFESKLRQAKSTDAIEDYPEPMPESDWVTRRTGSDATEVAGIEGID